MMVTIRMRRIYAHDEGMRLVDDRVALQEVALRAEADFVDHVAEADQTNLQVYRIRVDRTALNGDPSSKLGRHTRLENRELDGEVPVSEHAAVVRPALHLFPGFGSPCLGRSTHFWVHATGAEKTDGKTNGDQNQQLA